MRLAQRLARLEQQARPDAVGIWDTEDDGRGRSVKVWWQGQLLETVTVDLFRQQYPDGTLLKIVYGELEGTPNARP